MCFSFWNEKLLNAEIKKVNNNNNNIQIKNFLNCFNFFYYFSAPIFSFSHLIVQCFFFTFIFFTLANFNQLYFMSAVNPSRKKIAKDEKNAKLIRKQGCSSFLVFNISTIKWKWKENGKNYFKQNIFRGKWNFPSVLNFKEGCHKWKLFLYRKVFNHFIIIRSH